MTHWTDRRDSQTDLALLIHRLASLVDNARIYSDEQLERLTFRVACWYEDLNVVHAMEPKETEE